MNQIDVRNQCHVRVLLLIECAVSEYQGPSDMTSGESYFNSFRSVYQTVSDSNHDLSNIVPFSGRRGLCLHAVLFCCKYPVFEKHPIYSKGNE